MKEIIFVTGGCRSGKSRFASAYANEHFQDRVFVATATALDDEMAERIKAHQANRGADWTTIEEPIEIGNALGSIRSECDVVLIDCMTLWISNLLAVGEDEQKILGKAETLVKQIQRISPTVIVVSNEVGYGIVPENKLARQFRDITGSVNQKLAACADVVVWTVAGLPQVIKGDFKRGNRE